MSEQSPRTYSMRDRVRFAGRALMFVGAASMELGTLDALNTVKVRANIEAQFNEILPPLPEEQLAQGELDRTDFIKDSYEYWLDHPEEETVPITDPEAFFNGAFTQEYTRGREMVFERTCENVGATRERAAKGVSGVYGGALGVIAGYGIEKYVRGAGSSEQPVNETSITAADSV